MNHDSNCLFCKIVAGDLPSSKVAEDDLTLAFMDINPWTKGHTLVISKEHAATFFELSEAAAIAVMRTAHKIAPTVKDAVGAEGMNLFQSNGRAAWQQVDHYHLHLIPRWFKDTLVPPTTPTPGNPEEIRQTAQKIKSALQ
ncbi:MAG: HIT family protein [Actinomycetota bacterium]